MGIKPGYEEEIWEAPGPKGQSLYGGWYPFIGNIIHLDDKHKDIDHMEFWVSGGWAYSLPWISSQNAQELNFSTEIEWILDEPREPDV